ncbi:conserved hypothetical protein (DUF1573) [Formosa sp. Hel3_A1_48]|jgi:hypothetical protein|uniref:DUF1573 domain-containing protein n=1 Tax=Formosa sp. Hel3_A1_48 TaxID=1336795 RepID=UPI00084E348A|nr:DUF1573 domain-containing protein [Formosa sp. Hel3_A1_48]AOR26716.1 conserved hypothetical protein (DUF1573) [Formosa sp. Hel3_A1_48]MDA9846324.1 DUF1573 domain-containing protein [Flavobacteriaceae bacterium]MDC0950944.1 DUF1573 domain-containing protein [Flavobacteriaceae bacterium]
MKKLFLLFTSLALVSFTSCKENASEKINQENVTKAAERDAQTIVYPSVTFDKVAHDFGEIQNGTPVETVFTYTNSGQSPLVVTDIKSTCGCTVPQGWSREPLAPGASSQFTVKFNGKGANKVSKTITLTTNTESGREQVRISAFIVPDPNAAPVVKTQ